MTSVDELVRRATDPASARSSYPRGVPARPAMAVAILTCMDARIDPARLFGLEPGEAHVLRNAGGVVTEDVLRSLLLSQRLLETTGILVVHHTRCGLHGLDEAATRDRIEAETGTRPPYALEVFDDLDDDVRRSIDRIRTSPCLRHDAAVRGFVYDVDDGTLREVT